MRQVTRDEFFAHIGPLDVTLDCQKIGEGYRTLFHMRNGRALIGRTEAAVRPYLVFYFLDEECMA